jgi:hypothetical protein
MKKMPVFPFFLSAASDIINTYPGIKGFSSQPFDSISLFSSTIAWLCYLFSFYFLGQKESKRSSLVNISLLLIATIIFPLMDVFIKSKQNFEYASTGILPGIYTFLNYASRILLLLFSVSIIIRKELLLRVVMILLATLIFTSFVLTSYELIAFLNKKETTVSYSLISKILDPIAIISLFILQLYFMLNRSEVVRALKNNTGV